MTIPPVPQVIPSPPETVLPLSGNRRLVLATEGLALEIRSGGYWTRARVIPYADIRAAYQYEVADWGPLGTAVGILSFLGFWGLILFSAEVASGPILLLGFVVLAVLLVGGGLHRSLTAPRRMLRIEAYSGPLVLPSRTPDFFPALAARLPKPVAPAVPPLAPRGPELQPAGEASSQSGSSGASPQS